MNTSFFRAVSSKKALIAFVSAIVIAGIAFTLFRLNMYPLLTVNGSSIFAEQLQKNYQAVQVYYEQVKKMDQESSLSLPSIQELEVGILNQLIEAEIISQATIKEFGDDLDYLINDKLEKYKEDTNFHETVKTLYGMSFEDFTSEVLIPQAKRDILAGKLILQGKQIDMWLVEAKQSARVNVYSSKFIWQEGMLRVSQ